MNQTSLDKVKAIYQILQGLDEDGILDGLNEWNILEPQEVKYLNNALRETFNELSKETGGM